MEAKTPADLAIKFRDACQREGYTYSYRNEVVTVNIKFTPNDREAYCKADSTAYSLIALVPASGGSIWGTTSDGIGGAVGMKGGYYTLNKSGVKKRFLAALVKLAVR